MPRGAASGCSDNRLLKVEKACLQNPGKIRTSVGGDRREQTHCFHDRHIGGGGLERSDGHSRPARRHLASLVGVDAFAGELTRGSNDYSGDRKNRKYAAIS